MRQILFMSGYGLYVWSAVALFIVSLTALYILARQQFQRTVAQLTQVRVR